MAFIKWVSTTGDGSSTASFSTGSLPTGSDYLLFDGTSQVSWSSGLDASSWGVVNVRSNELFTGDIGTSGTYATLYGLDGAGGAIIQHHFHHSGKLYLNLTSAVPGADLADCEVRNPNRDRTRYHIDGDFNALTIRGGGVTIDAGLTLDVLRVFGDTSNVLIESGFTNAGATEIWGGVVENQSAEVPTVYGGVLIEKTQNTTFTQYGGTIDYRPTTPAAITDLTIYDGTFIISGDAMGMLAGLGSFYIGPNVIMPGVPHLGSGSNQRDFRKEFP